MVDLLRGWSMQVEAKCGGGAMVAFLNRGVSSEARVSLHRLNCHTMVWLLPLGISPVTPTSPESGYVIWTQAY